MKPLPPNPELEKAIEAANYRRKRIVFQKYGIDNLASYMRCATTVHLYL
jgi:hypothetical protein